VERRLLEECLEAARLAPSAENGQPWRFVVFDDPGKKEALAQAVFRGAYAYTRPLSHAPVLVALLIRESVVVNRLGGGFQGIPFQFVDAAIAGEHFVLAATERDLGTCWIGWFDARALLKHLGLARRGYRSVALIAVGYPAGDREPRERKLEPLDRIAGWNEPPG
jgi:nitroreductase